MCSLRKKYRADVVKKNSLIDLPFCSEREDGKTSQRKVPQSGDNEVR